MITKHARFFAINISETAVYYVGKDEALS